ncbi:NAD(P)/FAD-dependent oxidoreductase [Salisediminibacterium halotolerans]|uniref:NADH dehydrogenase n=1 Tax=Salisediminibacterium halotolerans TaxID=517425 RepID=A0A1H9WQY5_9BACI|nr:MULTISPECIES: NAD(P)/FAD-dependent oxidoreductase [Salisediminibacterium]RLJ75387.1 NADH dehydrogenase [Actinophytocola xinjiangensis]RPE89241.1 NADH dehydrogenase [Salisediminibacterium halotolerans]TWG36000.1 NADH dehydrogenase [Salisediminibacterium halotolerans]SES36340.1 NADH dehydrogenase [Salisediminibacterium haloalkalitolerans]GEL07793.1 NADH dehydrogenase-like protein YutJ [Salisediminibacterium halotolerans]
MKKLVILGGGYGGLRAIHKLLDEKNIKEVSVLLIEKEPYHSLKTEFYALAAGTVSDQELRIQFPNDIRLELMFETVTGIDLESQEVSLSNGEAVFYDDLIIGLGCEDKYHGVPGADEHTLSIQSMRRARKTYQVLQGVRPNGRVTIVGAGLSGVELASELRESRPDLEIILFDRGETILSMFPKKLINYVTEWFDNNEVQIVNHANITKVERNKIFNHDEPLETDAVIWTAGIQANKLVRELDVPQDAIGRLKVTEYHHLPDYNNVFVVGDCATSEHAPSAQLAEAQAERVVSLLAKKWNGEPYPEEMPKIKLKGVLGSLGKKHGFGYMGERPMTGRVPRVLKSGVLWMYKHHSGS